MTNTVRFHFCMVAKAMTLIKADSRITPVKSQEKKEMKSCCLVDIEIQTCKSNMRNLSLCDHLNTVMCIGEH